MSDNASSPTKFATIPDLPNSANGSAIAAMPVAMSLNFAKSNVLETSDNLENPLASFSISGAIAVEIEPTNLPKKEPSPIADIKAFRPSPAAINFSLSTFIVLSLFIPSAILTKSPIKKVIAAPDAACILLTFSKNAPNPLPAATRLSISTFLPVSSRASMPLLISLNPLPISCAPLPANQLTPARPAKNATITPPPIAVAGFANAAKPKASPFSPNPIPFPAPANAPPIIPLEPPPAPPGS